MTNEDTVKILKECSAGIKMGVASIDEVLDHVKDSKLKHILSNCKNEHEEIEKEVIKLLKEKNENEKSPNPVAKSMSWIKTNTHIAVNESDATIADLITDGCNMGVKSLNKYLNQYNKADEKSKDLAKKLINSEEHLTVNLRPYL